MCDFHSVIVDGAGRIYHHASNSHSRTALHFRDILVDITSLDAKWWEVEWDGKGSQPVNLIQTRGKTSVPTALAISAADRHYAKLAAILRGEIDVADCEPFNQPEYIDVQSRVKSAKLEAQKLAEVNEAETLGENLATSFDDMSDDAIIAAIRKLAETLNVEMTDVAAEECKEAEERGEENGSESSYDSGYSAGVDAAQEDMYSRDEVEDKVKEAVEEAQEEAQEEADQAGYERGFLEGFAACRTGSVPTADYINGLPSFLFAK